MRSLLSVLIGLVTLFVLSGFLPPPQTAGATVTVINRQGQVTAHITDGDQVQLELTLPDPSEASQQISFLLTGSDEAVASCAISAGARSCRSEPVFSLGWHWEAGGAAQPSRTIQAFDAAGKVLAQSAAVTVAARPVVLVHGFISAWDTWKPYLGPQGFLAGLGLQGFAVGDGQVPGKMNTGTITDPVARTNTLAQNAEILGQYIDGVRQKTGAEMVDLVVHSMGGMISRYYIDRVMQGRQVAQLIMLGSPMGGSDCSVMPAALGFFLPASLEIRSSYMNGIFNRQITHRHGIQFHDLGGTAILEAYQSPCTDVPNDTVVSFGSINAIPLDSSQFSIIHSELTISQPVFDDFVRPLLTKPAGGFAPAQDSPSSAEPASQLQFTRVYTGHVDRGGSTELTINIEADVAVASFALYDPTRSTDVSVRGASGKVIQLDAAKNGLIRIDDPSSMLYLGYGFSKPKPGPWKVTVLATDKTPASGADFAISVYFVGGAVLRTGTNTLVPRIGEEVDFTSSLSLGSQPLQITAGQVLIRHPDGTLETLEMQPGAQAAASWRPAEPGTYGADVVITAQPPDGPPVERTAFLALEVQPNPTRARVTTNLVLVLAGALIFVALILYLAFRGLRRILRRRSNNM